MAGDFFVNGGDEIVGTGGNAAEIHAANNAIIGPGARFDFSADGRNAGPSEGDAGARGFDGFRADGVTGAVAGDGGDGGSGGDGGRGGDNGDGDGDGGFGRLGAGGTVKIVGSAVGAGGTIVSAEGGADPFGNGGAGRFVFGNNTAACAPSAAATTEAFAGPVEANPFIKGTPDTPFIPDLQDGAELFGLLAGIDAENPLFGGLVDDQPPRSLAAITRLDIGPGPGYDDDFLGYDMALMLNLTDAPLADPMFGVDPADTDTTFLSPLLLGGWTRDAEFGGSGDKILGALGGGSIFATLVPDGSTLFNGSVNGFAGGGVLANGEVAYITAPIPLPAPAALLVAAIGGLAALRRRAVLRG